MVYILRTGTIRNALPREKFGGLGSSALHHKFQQWTRAGFFRELWRKGLAEYDEMEGIARHWQSADGTNIEAPLARESVGPNPTDRGKNGSKRSLLVDERGVPLSLIDSGANRHDSVVLEALLKERLTLEREDKTVERNLCLDAGYVGKEAIVREQGFEPHIRPRGEEKQLLEKDPAFKARRWVVEAAHSWFNRFRKLTPRYEKTDESYVALCMLASAMITLNKVMTIYG